MNFLTPVSTGEYAWRRYFSKGVCDRWSCPPKAHFWVLILYDHRRTRSERSGQHLKLSSTLISLRLRPWAYPQLSVTLMTLWEQCILLEPCRHPNCGIPLYFWYVSLHGKQQHTYTILRYTRFTLSIRKVRYISKHRRRVPVASYSILRLDAGDNVRENYPQYR